MRTVNLITKMLITHPKGAVITSLLLALTASLGILKLEISPDNRAFYGPENRHYTNLLQFEDSFEVNSQIVFVVVGDDAITDSVRFRSALSWLESESYGIENYVRASSLNSMPQPLLNGDELIVAPLLKTLCSAECDPKVVRMLGEPRFVGRAISPDLNVVSVSVVVDVDPEISDEVTATYRSAQNLAKEFEASFPEFELLMTGAVPMMQAFVDTAAADSVTVVGLAFVIIWIFMCLALGNFRVGTLLFTTGLLASTVSLGLAGWVGLTINTATSVSPIVIFTLVVAGAMHLTTEYMSRLEDIRGDTKNALQKAYRSQLLPIFLATLTSAISLFSLIFVTAPPIQELGVLASLGVIVGFILTFTILGLLLPLARVGAEKRIRTFVSIALRELVRRDQSKLLITLGSVALLAAMSLGMFKLNIDDDFIRYFDEDVEFRADVERMLELGIGSPYHIEVVLSVESGLGVFQQEILNYSRDLTEYLRENELILNVSSIVDVIDEVAKNLDVPKEMAYQSKEVASQLFLTYELGLPVNSAVTDYISADGSELRFSILLRDLTSAQTQEIEKLLYIHHSDFAPDDSSLLVTGENVPVAHLSEENIADMVNGVGPVLLMVALVFAVLARSFLLFCIGLTAIVVPILAGFGLWGWAVGEVGLAATIVLAITIGVVIDDGIHILFRFEEGRRKLGLIAQDAAAYAVEGVGPAVVFTSVCLSLGFFVLLFSSYAVNQVFGFIACVIFLLAMLFDLLMLPKLLSLQRVAPTQAVVRMEQD